MSEIVEFYTSRKIPFFLFAPSLAIFNYVEKAVAISLQASVTYENGAKVVTSFLTNMEDDGICVRTDPELYKLITEADKEMQRQLHKELLKYIYPANIVTAAMMGRWSKYGIEQGFRRESVKIINGLDEQKEFGKAIYGKGLLLSEKAAAEKAAAITWTLSDRERAIVASLK